MKMKRLIKQIAALTLALVASYATAGEFRISCAYKNDNLQKCATVVADLVSDKFIKRFPATKFSIFVYSHISSFSNGGYSAHAVSGVIPGRSNEFPKGRFSVNDSDTSNKPFTEEELAEIELKIFRKVVQNLMEQCEISPNCDVYSPR